MHDGSTYQVRTQWRRNRLVGDSLLLDTVDLRSITEASWERGSGEIILTGTTGVRTSVNQRNYRKRWAQTQS